MAIEQLAMNNAAMNNAASVVPASLPQGLEDQHMMQYTISLSRQDSIPPTAATTTTTTTTGTEIPLPELQDQLMMQYTMSITKPVDPNEVPAEELFEKLSTLKHQQQRSHRYHSSSVSSTLRHPVIGVANHPRSRSHSPSISHTHSRSHSPSSSSSAAHPRSRSHSHSGAAGQDAYPMMTLTIDTTCVTQKRNPRDTLKEILQQIDYQKQEKENEMETEIIRRHHHHRRLNPDLLKEHHTLKQNHGRANLQHS
ncbi:hypothetical protein BGZ58_000973 [Dissophora ornata]|nr:hypothetical protein BGZ58_000973 [Dissophora ornata]